MSLLKQTFFNLRFSSNSKFNTLPKKNTIITSLIDTHLIEGFDNTNLNPNIFFNFPAWCVILSLHLSIFGLRQDFNFLIAPVPYEYEIV